MRYSIDTMKKKAQAVDLMIAEDKESASKYRYSLKDTKTGGTVVQGMSLEQIESEIKGNYEAVTGRKY